METAPLGPRAEQRDERHREGRLPFYKNVVVFKPLYYQSGRSLSRDQRFDEFDSSSQASATPTRGAVDSGVLNREVSLFKKWTAVWSILVAIPLYQVFEQQSYRANVVASSRAVSRVSCLVRCLLSEKNVVCTTRHTRTRRRCLYLSVFSLSSCLSNKKPAEGTRERKRGHAWHS